MNKGLVFGLDLMLSFIVTCTMLYLMLASLNSMVEERASLAMETELKQKAIFLADSLAKNHSPESPWKGAAFFDQELKRVKANLVDRKLLQQISESTAPKEVNQIYLRKGNQKEFFLKRNKKQECFGIERTVEVKNGLLAEKKAIGIVVCSE